jgi:hypothetical protein
VNTYSRILVNLRKLSTLQFNNKMNIYTFKVLMKHSMNIEEKNDPENKFWTCFHISEVGPPNRPDLNKIRMIKQLVTDIPHSIVTNHWWSDMSEGRCAINRGLKLLKSESAFVEEIDDIGNLTITNEESSPTIFKEFTIEADIKTLKRLEDIAAYNIARLLLDINDLDKLQLPRSLNTLVASFLDTY